MMIWSSVPFLGAKADMDDIADAIIKVYENRDQLKKVSI
jgi:perosamine synthetase